MKGSFVDVMPADLAHIAVHLRAADREELSATRPIGAELNVAAVLQNAVGRSSFVKTGVAPDGEPVALLGVAPMSLLGGIGCPWMLGTDRVFEFPRAFIKEGTRLVGDMLGMYPHLINYVDARNVKSIRWLKRLGFTVDDQPVPYGPKGVPFHRFELGY